MGASFCKIIDLFKNRKMCIFSVFANHAAKWLKIRPVCLFLFILILLTIIDYFFTVLKKQKKKLRRH